MSLPPTLSLYGKVAIVTGASRGLGKDIALELASRGASICITYTAESSAALAEVVAEDVRKHGEIIEGTLRGLDVEEIDILVNNAAIGQEHKPWQALRLRSTKGMIMDTSVRRSLLLVQALIPHLAAEGSRIISISYICTKYPVSGMTMYATSKAALEQLTRQWGVELAKKHHLTVNAINCGPLDKVAVISQTEAVVKARERFMSVTSAAHRMGTCDDLAEIVAFLASEGNRWINGQVVFRNGAVTFF